MDSLIIYTDGSHKAKWGSWAFVIVLDGAIVHEASGRTRYTNSLRMEFHAAIEALSFLKPKSHGILFSDSRILINAVNNPLKRPAINSDQMETILKLSSDKQLNWSWVKAHSGNVFNDRCDELCTQARLSTIGISCKITPLKLNFFDETFPVVRKAHF